uniref:ABC transporter patM n=1 Tax=Penicillium expansum TaxID=27334 RepID=PATM_PENEN|nr:RecName: Full=ABC transporter patM; AltName: Full=Patulin biosynthesis cluster protein M [Penicillium expansum]ABN48540.1 ABC transporter [Penicillium expansum]AIG62140.1 ABC transporter [Penicillium expansum]
MVDNYHSSLDVAKTPIQSDADAQKSEAETEGPSSKSSQIAAGESIADSVRNFLELRQGGIPDDTGVVFDKISAVGSGTGSQDAPTVTSAAQSAFGLLSPLQNRQRKQYSRPILSGFSGTINPGEMLLVLGKPGSGCTTFLKTLSGLWDEYKEIQGELTLGGHPLLDVMKQRPQDILFCAESDDHFPTLTVAETLRFATRARCGPQVSAREIDTMVTQLAKLVGLGNVLNTKVGDAKIRGVSGGERRRVSLAEALATCARLICLDNPTHGLDSSTAVEFMEMMREWTTQSRCVAAMSVYQASDAIVSYFDKVLIINSGRQIYYGPVRDAKAYFEDLGFECLSTTTVADFLNVMSADPDVRRAQENRENQVPRTAEEFERAFSASPIYQEMQKSVQVAKERFQTNPSPLVKTSAFALPIWHQIWYCAGRQFRIVTSDYSLWAVELATIVVQSLVLGTLFRNQQRTTSSLFIFASALFYSVLVPALQSMAEFGNGFAQRPLILKQKRYQISRPIAYALGLVTTDVVWKVAAICYNIPLYFLTGFQRTAGNFFTWFLIIYLEHLALSMFFRSVAIFSPNMHRAVLPVGIFFNMYVLYTGLYVPAPQMQVWLGWLRYLNPLYYAFESVMVNEFRDLSYQCSASDPVPSGLGYNDMAHQVCAVVGSEPGDRLLSGASYIHAQYGFKTSHLWRNVGINAALFVFFALCSGIGMEMLKTPAGQLATVFYKSSPGVTHRRDKIDSETGQDQGNESSEMSAGQSNDALRLQEHQGPDKSHNLAWTNLCLDIKTKEGDQRLLNNLSGSVKSGQLKALMGVSGAGKTTLLNALAGRSTIGNLTGTLALNGQVLPTFFRSRMGYVQQQDIHLPTQTVREALQMTARLRRPESISVADKNAYVEKVIEWLSMEHIADALVGVPGAGLNLEQRKKVSIGVEMASKPEILFLDEPTSGLDGQSAMLIARLLRRLADSGQAILCTIHQPAAELIDQFDKLYLLSRGGNLVYDGSLGTRCHEAIQYFQPRSRPCGPEENPAEYFLAVIGAGSRNDAHMDWASLWNDSEQGKEREKAEESLVPAAEQAPQLEQQSLYSVPFHVQLWVVVQRTWLYYWREPDYVNSKLWMSVGNSLLNSLTHLQSPNTERGAYNRVFSAFMSLIVGPPLGLQVQPRFVTLRDIFVHRERESLTYHWLAFVLSAFIVELPFTFLSSLVYWLLWYFPVGYFNAPSRAGYSFLMYELFGVFATSLAQLCASLMPNIEAAFAANGFFFMFCNTFAGTLSPKPVTPSGWRWFYNISPLFYLGEGVTVDVLQDLPIRCEESEVSIFYAVNGTTCGQYAQDFLKTATGYLLNPASTTECQYCRYRDGQSYFQQYGYEFAHRHRNIGVFICFIAFNFTMVLVMTYLTKTRRH